MSEEPKEISPNEVFDDLCGDVQYAIQVLGASRQALVESKIGKSFDGKPPRAVIMHAVSHALMSDTITNLDRTRFQRGVIALCLFYLEDEDVSLALKIRDDLKKA